MEDPILFRCAGQWATAKTCYSVVASYTGVENQVILKLNYNTD